MSDSKDESEKDWLGLGEAAHYLGVHGVTLRRWADAGEIGTMRTAGGHRRFALAEVKRFAAVRQQLSTVPQLEQIWADKATSRSAEVVVHHRNAQWMQAYDESGREQSRLLGRRLMAIVLQTITTDKNSIILLDEARAIGEQYALNALAHGLSITMVLEATIYFRDAMFESALLVPEVTHHTAESNARLLKSINTIVNAVQLSVANTYDRSKKQ